jgi:hypothetical protein
MVRPQRQQEQWRVPLVEHITRILLETITVEIGDYTQETPEIGSMSAMAM